MLGMASFYNPNDHTIIGGEIGPFCERLVKGHPRLDGRIFVVRYNKIGSFVIARWLGKPFDAFVDILNLGKSLANFNRKKANELRRRLFKPLSAEATSVGIAEAESDFHHDMQDWNEEEGERLAKCARGE